MTHLNDLYTEADNNNIVLESFGLSKTESLSVCIDDTYFIAIDQSQLKNNADEKVKLAHEMGHCMTGAFYNRYSKLNDVHQQEAKANRWAVRRLIQPEDFQAAFEDGIVEIWELAEHFEVTEDFIRMALQIYEECGQYQHPVCED